MLIINLLIHKYKNNIGTKLFPNIGSNDKIGVNILTLGLFMKSVRLNLYQNVGSFLFRRLYLTFNDLLKI